MSENLDKDIQKINDESDLYVTSDLYLSAYLLVKGHKFTFEKKTKKAFFSFPQDHHLDENVNEYLMGSGSITPLAFANAIKNLKNLLFNK
jgi:hypothetical protein